MKLLEWDINLKVRLFGELLMNVLFWMFVPFMAIYFKEEFGEALAGFLMVIPPIAGILANLFGGTWADRYGRKRMMQIAIFIEAVSMLIFAFSPSAWLDFLIFNCLTVASIIYQPASLAMVADLVPVHERRDVFAVFYMNRNIGVVLGPMIGSVLFFTYRTELILGCSIAAAIFFVLLNKYVHETVPAHTIEQSKKSSTLGQLKNFMVIFKDKLFFLYVVAGVIIHQTFLQMDFYLSIYVYDQVHDAPLMRLRDHLITVDGAQLYGMLVSLNGIMVVLLSVAITRAIRNWSDKRAFTISALLFGFSYFLMAFSLNPWYLLFCIAIFTIAEMMRTPVLQNFITKISPEDQRGQYLGASSLQFSIGQMIAPLSLTLSGIVSPFWMFTSFFVTGIIGALLYAIMFNLYDKQMAGEEEHSIPQSAEY